MFTSSSAILAQLRPETTVTGCAGVKLQKRSGLHSLFCFFLNKRRQGHEPELAFVRWLTPARKPAHAEGIQLTALKYAMVKLKGIRAKVFQTDIVSLNSIIGLCFIQPDPLDAKVFYYNHWIGNTANDDPRHPQSVMSR